MANTNYVWIKTDYSDLITPPYTQQFPIGTVTVAHSGPSGLVNVDYRMLTQPWLFGEREELTYTLDWAAL